MEYLDRFVCGRRHCWRRRLSNWRRRVNFNVELEICACRHVEKCFLARLPPEDGLERDSLVGVLFDQNAGRRKILSKKVASGRVFRWQLWLP